MKITLCVAILVAVVLNFRVVRAQEVTVRELDRDGDYLRVTVDWDLHDLRARFLREATEVTQAEARRLTPPGSVCTLSLSADDVTLRRVERPQSVGANLRGEAQFTCPLPRVGPWQPPPLRVSRRVELVTTVSIRAETTARATVGVRLEHLVIQGIANVPIQRELPPREVPTEFPGSDEERRLRRLEILDVAGTTVTTLIEIEAPLPPDPPLPSQPPAPPASPPSPPPP